MKKNTLAWMAAIGGACLLTAVVSPRLARSADHLDSPAPKADPAADINDVYTFMDGSNAVFAMTVFPAATDTAKFSDATAYVFHVSSTAAFGTATSQDVNIICTFDAAQTASCWAGDEYVTGNANSATGITSTSGKLKVFAGLRKDPFFFNLQGFRDTVGAVKDAVDAGAVTSFDAGCPEIDPTTAGALRGLLTSTDGGTAQDFFKDLKTLAIVVSIDKTLVAKAGPVVSVWASTNKKQ